MNNQIKLPAFSLVLLIGASGMGKTSFAAKHFGLGEVISSDTCRGWVSGDENSLEATPDAFAVLHYLLEIRLRRGLLSVVDATNVRPEDRKRFVELARKYHCLPVGIVFDLPIEVAQARNQARPDRQFGEHVVRNQALTVRRHLRSLEREGFRYVHVLRSEADVTAVELSRTRLYNDLRDQCGPFDVIGDVHGCAQELDALLLKLGYALDAEHGAAHPEGRTAVFVGDLVDRGPDTPGVLRRVMQMVRAGHALCTAGNHEVKLVRALRSSLGTQLLAGAAPPTEQVESGKNAIKLSHGLLESLTQLAKEDAAWRAEAEKFMDGLVSHYVLDGGKLIVAHAGLPESMHGRASGKVRSFALYGDTTGETDEFGLPIRYPWAMDYRGKAKVVYGHTPTPKAEWLNNTICLDTGCVFGGELTALRYPEKELVSVPAQRVHYAPVRPLGESPENAASAQQLHDRELDLADVLGKQLIRTRYSGPITIFEENSTAALEVMSRFAIDPKWLIYLPPTMSPPETSEIGDFLEHPQEAFAYYRKQGVARVLCQEKHMGSRAVMIICRNAAVAAHRFGVQGTAFGTIYTRTGWAFFSDPQMEAQVLEKTHSAISRADWWQRFESDWFALDLEIMPWSAKALDLIKQQYAQVGVAANARHSALAGYLADTHAPILSALPSEWAQQAALAQRYNLAYQRYIWPVRDINDLRLAPFHLLASEAQVHSDKSNDWHMRTLAELTDSFHIATRNVVVDLSDSGAEQKATDWWLALTEAGGEGMVVKPWDFYQADAKNRTPQPAIKCRGPEYLRIIYGPEYSLPNNLTRLRKRALAGKRKLAMREFALGLEAMQRFIERRPLREVHQCVFGILALESEAIDPRL